ncbi:hypothetical protein BOTBODRAFT_27486 [Botryobasidium botryosum FD-172 SS1]|uniref:Nab2 type CCCH zinc finger 4 domain-containing protein n=1 Tax=Botryobasidium botryosum (strain FD-172 SS1) TaxID=930990 RepID=A0A067MZC7_BOTB1|nr:hypothetical protein BOTBODRAFT_27486 [Botryobasidium botryosum FD-172 SS1]
MTFDLTMGTPKAQALQTSIQKELAMKGYSTDDDPVMAEYITIMLINNKTPDQITGQLIDLIGSEYDSKFTDWLFAEAGAVTSETEEAPATQEAATESATAVSAPSARPGRAPPTGPRSGGPLLQQALSSLSTSPSQKRSASNRSPSPSSSQAAPNKLRKTSELPDRPRAMRDENGPAPIPTGPPRRTLLERVGGGGFGPNSGAGINGRHPQHDRIQMQIDAITQKSMMENNVGSAPMAPPTAGMGMMDMPGGNMMAMNQMMMAQQMEMMHQMQQMQQMMAMGMNGLPPFAGFPGGQGIGPMDAQQGFGTPRRGRGGARGGGPGRGGGLAGSHIINLTPTPAVVVADSQPSSTPTLQAPTPVTATSATSQNTTSAPAVVPPPRPLSPTLCKFSTKCGNATCRYSHPSPVATPESALVLSTDACEAGLACKDADCTKSHPSPAVVTGATITPRAAPPAHQPTTSIKTMCKFGGGCRRPNCMFQHPRDVHSSTPCNFGAACTRADCAYLHPPGRVLPSSFHRGLSSGAPSTAASTPGRNKSMTFKPDPNAAPFVPRAATTPESSSAAKEGEAGTSETKSSNGDVGGVKEEKQPVGVAA